MSIINTGYKLPSAVIANASGIAAWLTPNNILLADDLYAVSSGPAQIMTVGNFNHNIPQTATILNITLRVKGYRGSFNTTLDLYAVDDTSGIAFSYPYLPAFQGFNGVNTVWTLNPTLFATTWTVDQANNIKVKLIADGELHLDTVEVDISYEDNSGAVPVVPSSGEVVCSEFVQAQPFQLARAMTRTDTFLFLTSFNYARPAGITEPILIGDFYGEAILVVDQGKPNEETFEITAVEHDYQGTGLVRLTTALADRGLMPKWPYTTDVTRRYNHSGTAEVVISNSARFYDRFLKKCQIDALVSAPIYVQDEGVQLADPVHILDFQGQGVTVVNDGGDTNKKIITIAGTGVTPPSVVNTSSATSGNVQVPTLTWSHVSSGLNRLLVVQVITEGAAAVTGVTYNGVALTLGISTTNGNIQTDQWYLLAPPVGTYNIIVSVAPNAYLTCGAETFNTVDQTTPIGATAQSTGNSNTPSGNIVTTNDNSIIVDAIGTDVLPIAYTVGPGQTENWHITANPNVRQGASSIEPSGTAPDVVTMSWALTQITPWAINRMEINGIASAIPADDHKVAATIADTTPNFLDDKIELVAGANVTINKVIINPGANEKIQYQVSSTGGAGGGSYNVDQTPDNGTYGLLAGAVNGINTTFTVSAGVYVTGKLFVFLNGLVQLQGAGDDFIELAPGAGTFQFVVAPLVGDIITAVYQDVTVLPSSLEIEEDGVLIDSGVTKINFKNGPNVTNPAPNEVDVDFAGLLGGGGGGSKLAIDTTTTVVPGAASSTVYTIPIPGGTLGSNDAVRYDIELSNVQVDNNENIHIDIVYGGVTISSLQLLGHNDQLNLTGARVLGLIIANNLTNAQKGFATIMATGNDGFNPADPQFVNTEVGTSAIDSTIAQDLEIVISNSGGTNTVTAEAIVVEQIKAGGSAVNVNNVTVFDDFLTEIVVPEPVGTGDTFSAYGNFGVQNTNTNTQISPTASIQNHPGIIRLSTTQQVAHGFSTMQNNMNATNGQLTFDNDFDITILTRMNYNGVFQCGAGFELIGAADTISVSVEDIGGVQDVWYNIGAGQVSTAVAVPATGTWFTIRFTMVSGVLTAYLDSNVIYTGAPAFTGGFYVKLAPNAATFAAYMDIDYVLTNYQLTR